MSAQICRTRGWGPVGHQSSTRGSDMSLQCQEEADAENQTARRVEKFPDWRLQQGRIAQWLEVLAVQS